MLEANSRATARILIPLLLLVLAGCEARRPPPRLLLIVSVDTLRADRLGAYGGDLGLTPQLDRLAAESLVFDWAYAPTSFTLPSVSTLLTGRYPEEIGILGNRSVLDPGIPTLASELRQRGWRTAAVVSNLVLHAKAGLAAGFDRYDDDLPGEEITRGWPERIAADTTDAALAQLDGLRSTPEQRLFLWVHYQDPHGPYSPPEGLRERFLDAERARPDGRRELPRLTGRRGQGRLPGYQAIDDRREVAFYRAGYDAEVHYLDGEVGRLLETLRSGGLLEGSVVVFTADHGESLGERDYWFAHGDRLDDALVRVPLLLRIPGTSPDRRRDVASLVDLRPTLLRLLEGVAPAAGAPGRDLLAPGADSAHSRPYLATLGSGGPQRFGIVEGEYKLILTQGERGAESELYRLGFGDHDLANSDPELTERLRESLRLRRAGFGDVRPEARQSQSETDRRNLRALGYIDDSEAPGSAGESAP